jgi:radical SAM superfamily enzyme YgiQ (UPF0313 family)
LVYPVIPTMTYWSFSTALKMLGKKSAFPPLGLATVAAMLPERCAIRLLDMNVEPLTDRDLRWADVVFVSAMIVQQESFEVAVKRANQFGIPVVAGGPYPSTAYPELIGVDHFVIGEAEPILDIFWADFCAGKAKKAYAMPVKQAEFDALRAHFGQDLYVEQARERPDINATPIPRFDLLNRKKYRAMSIQASRGCPIGCEFCDIWRRFGRQPRFKNAARITAELDELYRLKWKGSVFIVDDNFIGNKKRAKELLAAIADWQKEHGYPFLFFTEGTLTLADDEELLEGFQNSNFDMIFIGIETPAEESLKETRKHINIKGSVAEKVEKIQRRGIQVTSGFILGFDHDPDDIADRMIEFIQQLGIPVAMVGLLQALPETDLYDRLQREGRLLSQASGNNTHAFQTNFRTTRPAEAVSADYQKILQAIYPPDLKSYFERCAILIKRWKNPCHSSPISWNEVRAFFSYIGVIPFKAYRWNAFKFLVKTLWYSPTFFVEAVSLGVQGHHFREITLSAFEAVKVERYFAEKRAAFSRFMMHYLENTAQSREILLLEFRKSRDEVLSDAGKRFEKLHDEVRQAIKGEYEKFLWEINEMYQKVYASLAARAIPEQEERADQL